MSKDIDFSFSRKIYQANTRKLLKDLDAATTASKVVVHK